MNRLIKKTTKKIDESLYIIGHGITKHRFAVLALMIVIIASFISFVPKITVDTTTEGFLHKKDPMRIRYDKFRDQFGRDEKIIIAIKTDGIFKFKNITKLRDLHNELAENVPYLNDITSLINARNTKGDDNNLLVEDLFENWPKNQAELNEKKKIALSNPVYKNLLLSEDAKFSVIVLESNIYTSLGGEEADEFAEFDEESSNKKKEFITDEENSEMVKKVREIAKKYRTNDFKIYIAGSPSVTDSLKSSMQSDVKKFNGLIILTIIIFLTLIFRRISGVILPLVAVVLAVLSTVGLMAFFGTPIKIPTQIIPSFLLAVGVGTSIHILAIFFHQYDKYGDKKEAIAYTMKHSGFAIIMTSLTTAAGVASFSFSSVAPVADLGIYSGIGVLIALLYSMVLLPVLLAIFPIKRKAHPHIEHKDKFEKFLEKMAHFSQIRAKPIVIFSISFMIISIFIASQMKYSHNPLKWFDKNDETRVATELIDKELRGSINLEIIIDTKKENGLYNYKLLKEIEAVTDYAKTITTDDYFVGKVISVLDVIKEIHKALHENKEEFYAIPKDKKLLAQEILLFENSGSDDLEDFVDSQFSKARLTFKMPWIDAVKYYGLLHDLKKYLKDNIHSDVDIELTGMIPLLAETITAAIKSSGVSYVLAFVAITLMMIIVLADVKLGLLSMIPNLFPVFFVMAMAVVVNIPFDLFTMLVGSIILGLAVDDNVHFMHNFRRYHDREGKSVEEAIKLTLTGAGRAMLITTIVLSVGFFVYIFASMQNLINFGILAGSAIIVALLADFLLAPAMLALIYKNEKKEK